MLDSFIYISDLVGVITCAISGVLVATRLRMDPFGILVLAGVTGIGGGTLRDMMMGSTPVFWITDNTYIYVIIVTAILSVFLINRIHRFPAYLLPIFDAFGLSIFTIIGAQKALMFGFSGTVAIVMGCITGVVGGMIRDILSGQIPFVLQKEVYATASILGATLYVVCDYIQLGSILSMSIAMLGTLSLRLCAIYFHLSLPVFESDK
ncbi:trimeric intracellular cation channel family protein [Psychromonas aquatilis]|uniref:Trimeric intracellular cation channel family protein n=1 Tax=Psychromonas aquatilis TaxID=2005072 RepID=A0ABU9GRV7_9GAMM